MKKRRENIFLEVVKARIFSKEEEMTAKDFQFPKNIEGFFFVKQIKISKNKSFYPYGLYKNKEGQLAFVKFWSGSKKNLSYFWLKNEINIYKFLKSFLKHSRYEYTKHFTEVKIPDMIYSHIGDKNLLLMLEFIKGKKLNSQPPQNVNKYQKLLEFVDFVDKKTKKHIAYDIQEINQLILVLACVWLFIKSFIFYPNQSFILLRSINFFLKNLYTLLNKKNSGFTHRDIAGNVIVKGKYVYLTDFQVSAVTNKFSDYTNLFLYYWERKSHFREILKLKTISQVIADKKKLKLFKTLLIYALLFDLHISRNMKTKNIFTCLKFALSL